MKIFSTCSSLIKKAFSSYAFYLVCRVLLLTVLISVIIPAIWVSIPNDLKPETFWDFLNSSILCYIAYHITIKPVNECWFKKD